MTVFRKKGEQCLLVLILLCRLASTECFVGPTRLLALQLPRRNKIWDPTTITTTIPKDPRIPVLFSIPSSTDNTIIGNASLVSPPKRSYFFPGSRQVENFMVGWNTIHTRHLSLFWEYNFRKTALWIVPVFALLIGTQSASPELGTVVFDILKTLVNLMLWWTGAVGTLLHLPFRALGPAMFYLSKLLVPMLDHAPPEAAIPLAQLSLNYMQRVWWGQTLLVNLLAVFLFRPAMEEIQYRFILQKLTMILPSIGTTAEEAPIIVTPASKATVTTKSRIPPTSKSRRMLLSTIAFSATRLGWFCAHADRINVPTLFLQFATSPYCWAVGFMESLASHMTSLVQSELSPFLQRGLLLLALQQALSTFYVTWNVYVPLYQERGLAASIGANVAWTLGTVTWPFRLLGRMGRQMARLMRMRRKEEEPVESVVI